MKKTKKVAAKKLGKKVAKAPVKKKKKAIIKTIDCFLTKGMCELVLALGKARHPELPVEKKLILGSGGKGLLMKNLTLSIQNGTIAPIWGGNKEEADMIGDKLLPYVGKKLNITIEVADAK